MTVCYIAFASKKIGKKELETLSAYMEVLSSKDAKRFVDYLKSPFFNVDVRMVGLYAYIQEAASRDTERINASKLFNKWGVSLSAKELLQAIRTLTGHLKDFLVYSQVQADERLHLLVLNAKIRNQGKGSLVAELATKRKKALSKAPSDMSILMEDWWIDHQLYYEYDTDREANGLADLYMLQHKLDQLNGAARAMYACEEMHLRRVAHQGLLAPLPETSNIFTHLYELHKIVFEAPLAEFNLALRHFTQSFTEAAGNNRISSLNAYALAKYTINALSKVVNAGRVEWMEQLYEWQLRAEEYQPKPIRRIPSSEFLNRVNIGCYLKKIEDTVTYIQAYSPYLPPETRELDTSIANMYVLFEQGKYTDIIRAIDTEFSRRIDPHCSYNLRMKAIRLKAATELQLKEKALDEDYFQRVDEDLKKYLQRNKKILSEEVYSRYLHFLNLTRNVVKIKESILDARALKEACRQLLDKVTATQPIISKDWLIQKITFVADR